MFNNFFLFLEIEAILKADIRDPEVAHDIAKQLSIEKLKEFKKEIKPEDLIKCLNFFAAFFFLYSVF